MILAALAFAATVVTQQYESVLAKTEVPVFEAGEGRYEYYAENELADGRRVVVYGFTPARKGSAADVSHEVFVTMIARTGDHYEIVSPRRILTDFLFNIGERGRFAKMRASVNPFDLKSGHYVDVTLWSSISTGESAASDVIFRITNDGVLVVAAKLDETEAFRRKDGREISETSSELAVGDGALVWTKKERLASRKKSDSPYHVNCQTTRSIYRPLGRALSTSAQKPKGKLKPLVRVPLHEVVPCCSGCELAID
jgi:hypothetical protein